MEYAAGDRGAVAGRWWRPWSAWGFPGSTRHQGEALAHIRAGKNLLVATPTASGKTLIYNLPVLEALLAETHRATPCISFP